MGARSLFVAAVVCTLILSASGFAAPITLIEGPDLPTIGTPLPTFTLDVGINTISGTMTASTDFDSFAFTVPAGMQVTAADVTVGDLTNDLLFGKWTLFQGSANSGAGTQLGIITASSTPVPTTTLFNSSLPTPISLPLSPDTYNLTAGTGFAGVGTSSYTFSFTVVPEPTGLALAGCFAGAALLRRRCRAAAGR